MPKRLRKSSDVEEMEAEDKAAAEKEEREEKTEE